MADLYQDEEAFAAFVHYALSTTIKKSSWRLSRNKKLVSQIFTKYDEALALLILENNCAGIKEIVEGVPVDKKTIKTKYTCKGFKKKSSSNKQTNKSSDGGRGWTEEGMMRFSEIVSIVESSRDHGRRMGLELRIKQSYLVKRRKNGTNEEDDDDDEQEEETPRGTARRVIVCTGIPI